MPDGIVVAGTAGKVSLGFGLDALRAARSGREAVGMGGGPGVVCGRVPLLSPITSAEHLGRGGSMSLDRGGGGSICRCSSGGEGKICDGWNEGLLAGGGVVPTCGAEIFGVEYVGLSARRPLLLDFIPLS